MNEKSVVFEMIRTLGASPEDAVRACIRAGFEIKSIIGGLETAGLKTAEAVKAALAAGVSVTKVSAFGLPNLNRGNTAKVLLDAGVPIKDVYSSLVSGTTPASVASCLMEEAGMSAYDAADFLYQAELGEEEIAEALRGAGLEAPTVACALKEAGGYPAHLIARAMKKAGYEPGDIARALWAADGLNMALGSIVSTMEEIMGADPTCIIADALGLSLGYVGNVVRSVEE